MDYQSMITEDQVLDLSIKNLKEFPMEILKYKNDIKILYLGGNKLVTIPPEIGQLTNLRELFLSNNRLTSIPAEIEQLTNLRVLYLSNNELTNIPPEIGQLTNLRELYLGNNELTSLYLANNRLTNIPKELGQLSNLRVLYLNNNQLTSIPSELGHLTNLRELYLANNRLTNIPTELGHLTNLRELCLSNNQITSIPSEIGNIINLEVLYLDNNPIEYIPPQVQRLFTIQKVSDVIYQDKQSIHNSGIQRSFRSSVNRLSNKKSVLDLEKSVLEILDSTINKETKKSLVEYSGNKDIHSELNLTFGELLVFVWDRIRVHPEKEELEKRLEQEMSDALCMCFTGRITRLVNVLSGYDSDVEISISDNEQLSQLILLTKEKIVPYDVQAHRAFFEKEALERQYSLDTIQTWIGFIE